jgi:hypothetical protein
MVDRLLQDRLHRGRIAAVKTRTFEYLSQPEA